MRSQSKAGKGGMGVLLVALACLCDLSSGPFHAAAAPMGVGMDASLGTREGTQHLRLMTSMLSHVTDWWTAPQLVQKGKYLLDEGGNVAAAELALAQACAMDPTSVPAHFTYARLIQTKKPDEAERACGLYERVLQLDSSHIGAMCNYALVLHTHPLELWDDAEDLYERVLAMDPAHTTALANYGLLQEGRLDGKGSLDAAEFLFEEAVRGTGCGRDEHDVGISGIMR